MKGVLLFVVCCLLISCSGNKIPSGIIGIKQMTEIMWDVFRAQALAPEISRKDSSTNTAAETKVLTQKVLDIHNVTIDEYNKSYNWYVKHPDVIQIIFDSLYNQKQRAVDFNHGQGHKFLKKDSLFKKQL